ncbi:MAG: 30S ribosomal protein S1 [bacterium JZ-2024 1]
MTDMLKEPHIGEKVTGRVMEVSAHALVMDIGAKDEAYLPASEFGRLGKRARVNDEFDVIVFDRDKNTDQFLVSRRLVEQESLWQDLAKEMEARTVREGKVVQVMEKGLLVDIGGTRAFMPRSQVALKPVQDLSQFADKEIQCHIIEVDPQRKRVVVSRRQLLEEQEAARKTEAMAQIQVGQVYKGVVRRIVKFGAFVEVLGTDCLLHASEMGFSPNIDPHKMVKVGEEIAVEVISKDEERGRIALSRKNLLTDPWQDAEKRYKPGTIAVGKVTNLVNYGAFVRLEDGIEGLVHNSEISDDRGVTAQKKLRKGETIRVRVLEIDPRARRIRLTMKEPKEQAVPPEYLAGEQTRVTLGALTGLSSVLKAAPESPPSPSSAHTESNATSQDRPESNAPTSESETSSLTEADSRGSPADNENPSE